MVFVSRPFLYQEIFMKYWNVFLMLLAFSFALPVHASWPATADELTSKKLISFRYGTVSGRVNLEEKTFQVYTQKNSRDLCLRGNIPAVVNRLSDVEVEVETPPLDNLRTCHGRIFKFNTATKSVEMFEYYNNDKTVLRRVSKPYNIEFE